MTPGRELTQEIRHALVLHHRPGSWLFAAEYAHIDAFAVRLVSGFRVAYEIKASRGDFLQEIKRPQKSQFAYDVSNAHYFVLSAEAYKRGDENLLPHSGSGLMICFAGVSLNVVKKAERRWHANYPDYGFMVGFTKTVRNQYNRWMEEVWSRYGIA